MGAVCDVYDAITSDRPYKRGWAPAEAVRKMAEWCRGHFDDKIFHAFVKCVGIYPSGTLVRLKSGRLGVVMEQSGESLLKPKVRVFYSTKSEHHVRPEVVDLARSPDAIETRQSGICQVSTRLCWLLRGAVIESCPWAEHPLARGVYNGTSPPWSGRSLAAVRRRAAFVQRLVILPWR